MYNTFSASAANDPIFYDFEEDFRYMKERRRNAHVRPIAQYTEVAISGKNSSAPAPELLVLEGSGSGSGQMKPSLGVHAVVFALEADEGSCALGSAVMRGNTVTKRWRTQNPAR